MDIRWIGPALAATLALAPASAAAGGGEGDVSVVEHIFEMADRDGSGTLSSAEYGEAGLQRFGLSFEQSDTNSDGETSLAEYVELYEMHHPGHGGTEL